MRTFKLTHLYASLKETFSIAIDEKTNEFLDVISHMKRNFKFEIKNTPYKQPSKQNYVYVFEFMEIMKKCSAVQRNLSLFTESNLGKMFAVLFKKCIRSQVIDVTDEERRKKKKKLHAYLHLLKREQSEYDGDELN